MKPENIQKQSKSQGNALAPLMIRLQDYTFYNEAIKSAKAQ
jgi:hypothetical protein